MAVDGEVAGLLALMLLVDARRPARTDPDGGLVPLSEQDRSVWDRSMIAEGVALVTAALATTRVGRYQLQAAIAALHDEAPTSSDTDWPQIVALYRLLERVAPGPAVTLNRAVAEAMVHGPQAGLDLLDTVQVDERVSGAHRVVAVRAHPARDGGQGAGRGRRLPAGGQANRQHPGAPPPAGPREEAQRIRSDGTRHIVIAPAAARRVRLLRVADGWSRALISARAPLLVDPRRQPRR